MDAYYVGLLGALIIALIAIVFTILDSHSAQKHKH